MKDFYKDKNNHPMFGKTHTEEALALISKPGELNPMFGRKHSEATKASMSVKKNKYPLGVGMYDLDDNLILKFNNNVELAEHLGISKVTVGKYLNWGRTLPWKQSLGDGCNYALLVLCIIKLIGLNLYKVRYGFPSLLNKLRRREVKV